MEKLAQALCLEKGYTPCLWQFKTEKIEEKTKTDLKKEFRPGIVLEFLGETALVVFLSSQKEPDLRQPKVDVGRECTPGEWCERVKKLTVYVFKDKRSGKCLFKIPRAFLRNRSISVPCGNCKEEIKKRLFDECGEY